MYIKKLRLENLKGFVNVDFDFERPDGSFAGWTVLVGGNSSGKSTILKGIALALLGPDAGGRLMGAPAGWIKKDEARASAIVEIKWEKNFDKFKTGGSNPGDFFEAGVRWFIERKGDLVPQFKGVEKRNNKGTRVLTPERGPWSPNSKGWFSAAYGPMRRLTGSSSEAMRFSVSKETDSRFTTLFREDAALSESEEWLRRMHSRSLESKSIELERVLDGVKALLGDGLLPHGMRINRITVDHVYVVDGRGVELPMRDISDGCRSVYAMVLDLIHGMIEVYGADNIFGIDVQGRTVVDKPGIVIVDEIEAHLHPSWQRDISEWLTKHFPRIQFIVSTHSPLVAQAADPNGLFLLPQPAETDLLPRPASEIEYEKVRWGTAHKTVLGAAFGLSSTRSKWARDQIERWQVLSSKKHSAALTSVQEKKEFRDLEKQMALGLEEDVSELSAV